MHVEAEVAAESHLLVIAGSTDETYASFITEHFHFAGADQPPGVTLLGDMCHNAPDDAILVTRKYSGGGTFTYMGFAVDSYEDVTSRAQFLVPFLTG